MAKRSRRAKRSISKGKGGKKPAKNVIRGRPPGNQKVPITGDTMPEIFDSSKTNAMTEMKGSATMDRRDMTRTVSHMQRQEPMHPESVTTRPTSAEATNAGLPAVNPTIEERASVVKESERAASGRMDEDETLA